MENTFRFFLWKVCFAVTSFRSSTKFTKNMNQTGEKGLGMKKNNTKHTINQ